MHDSSSGSTGLPALSPDEVAHSQRVVAAIREEIGRAGGWIGFGRYMELALHAPGLGYYSAGAAKFGPDGDYVTAPEISPLFARCLAQQCADILIELAGGDILELGAGSGRMAADVLLELERLHCLPGHYLILERSAELRERQRLMIRRRAPQLMSRVVWLDRVSRQTLRGVMIANELLDALPIERFRVTGGAVQALGVEWTGEQLIATWRAASPALCTAIEEIEATVGARFAEGYTSEYCLFLRPWLASIAEQLRVGVILFIDYGLPRREYYHPARQDGTLVCHFRHRMHTDPLTNVGLQDFSAWVDFSAVALAASDHRLDVAGFTTQAQFLLALGLDAQLLTARSEDLVEQLEVARQAKILTLPGEMGERFKVLALSRDFSSPLRGFSLRDMRAML